MRNLENQRFTFIQSAACLATGPKRVHTAWDLVLPLSISNILYFP